MWVHMHVCVRACVLCVCMCVSVCACVHVCMCLSLSIPVHFSCAGDKPNRDIFSLYIYIIYCIVLFCDLYRAEHLFKSRLKDKKSLVYRYMYLC